MDPTDARGNLVEYSAVIEGCEKAVRSFDLRDSVV